MKITINNETYRNTFFNIIVSMVLSALIYVLCYTKPIAYAYLVSEDNWGEYGTAVCYFLSFIFIILSMMCNRSLFKPGYIVLALGLIFIGMEEISWGQRLIGVDTPYLLTKYNVQAEINFHNLTRLPIQSMGAFVILSWLVVLPILNNKSKFIYQIISRFGIPLVPVKQWPYFILALIFVIFPVVIKADEIGEMLLGLAFVLYCADTFKSVNRDRPLLNLPTHLLLGALMLAIVGLTGLFVAYGANTYSLSKYMNKIAIKYYLIQGYEHEAETVYRYLVKNPQLRTEDTLYHFSKFLMEDGRKDEAKGILTEALEDQRIYMNKYPDKPHANRMIGKIYVLLNDYDRAQQEFTNAISKDQLRLKGAAEDWRQAEIWTSLGKTYFAMEDYESSINSFEKAHAVYLKKDYRIMVEGWIEKCKEKALEQKK